jgi:soluble lytic murein transglycosylase-like protein
VTRALAVIGLLAFGLPPAAALAKAPQDSKAAPRHRAAAVHKQPADAAQDGDTTAKAHAVASKARVAHAKATSARKATATHKVTAAHKATATHTKTARAHHRPTSRGKVVAHRAAASHTKAAAPATKTARRRPIRELITVHAKKYSVPQHLVRRVIAAESGYNAKARNGPYIGLMQIALPTARGLGYHGDAAGLTDPDTNLKYGVAYLANAYRIAGKDEDRAVQLYRSGYYYAAKRKGMLGELIAAR